MNIFFYSVHLQEPSEWTFQCCKWVDHLRRTDKLKWIILSNAAYEKVDRLRQTISLELFYFPVLHMNRLGQTDSVKCLAFSNATHDRDEDPSKTNWFTWMNQTYTWEYELFRMNRCARMNHTFQCCTWKSGLLKAKRFTRMTQAFIRFIWQRTLK